MKKLITGLLIVAVLVGYGYGVWWAADDYNDGKDVVVSRTYEGRLYLPAEEYETFKQYLADNPQVEISRLEVLSSPNALVDMSLTAPADTIVPYGEMTYEEMKADWTEFAGNVGLMTVVLFAAVVLILIICQVTIAGNDEDI